jgi:hypothetical protein
MNNYLMTTTRGLAAGSRKTVLMAFLFLIAYLIFIMKSAGMTFMPWAESMCWIIFRAISRSFIPVAWNEQSNPQSLQQKNSILTASYGLLDFPLIILNKCKAELQCGQVAGMVKKPTLLTAAGRWEPGATRQISKTDRLFPRTIMMLAESIAVPLKMWRISCFFKNFANTFLRF